MVVSTGFCMWVKLWSASVAYGERGQGRMGWFKCLWICIRVSAGLGYVSGLSSLYSDISLFIKSRKVATKSSTFTQLSTNTSRTYQNFIVNTISGTLKISDSPVKSTLLLFFFPLRLLHPYLLTCNWICHWFQKSESQLKSDHSLWDKIAQLMRLFLRYRTEMMMENSQPSLRGVSRVHRKGFIDQVWRWLLLAVIVPCMC